MQLKQAQRPGSDQHMGSIEHQVTSPGKTLQWGFLPAFLKRMNPGTRNSYAVPALSCLIFSWTPCSHPHQRAQGHSHYEKNGNISKIIRVCAKGCAKCRNEDAIVVKLTVNPETIASVATCDAWTWKYHWYKRRQHGFNMVTIPARKTINIERFEGSISFYLPFLW